MTFARFMRDHRATGFKHPIRRRNRSPLVLGMMEAIEEDDGVECAIHRHAFIIGAHKCQVQFRTLAGLIFAGELDHILRDVLADYLIAVPSKENAGPSCSATHIQYTRGRRRKQSHDRADGRQVHATIIVGKWLINAMSTTGIAS